MKKTRRIGRVFYLLATKRAYFVLKEMHPLSA